MNTNFPHIEDNNNNIDLIITINSNYNMDNENIIYFIALIMFRSNIIIDPTNSKKIIFEFEKIPVFDCLGTHEDKSKILIKTYSIISFLVKQNYISLLYNIRTDIGNTIFNDNNLLLYTLKYILSKPTEKNIFNTSLLDNILDNIELLYYSDKE